MSYRKVVGEQKRPEPLRTREEVKNWLISLVEICEDRRVKVDVAFPKNTKTSVADQDKAVRRYYMAHGQALGALGMALRLGQIDDGPYNELVTRVQVTLLPTNVGSQFLGQIGGRRGR